MDQDTLRTLLWEAVRQTVTEVLEVVMELDREAFLQERGGRKKWLLPQAAGSAPEGLSCITFGYMEGKVAPSGLTKVPRNREGQYYPAFLRPYARRLVDVGGQPQATFQLG